VLDTKIWPTIGCEQCHDRLGDLIVCSRVDTAYQQAEEESPSSEEAGGGAGAVHGGLHRCSAVQCSAVRYSAVHSTGAGDGEHCQGQTVY
jgi:hypothetical protein